MIPGPVEMVGRGHHLLIYPARLAVMQEINRTYWTG